jgi:hypothetical protein
MTGINHHLGLFVFPGTVIVFNGGVNLYKILLVKNINEWGKKLTYGPRYVDDNVSWVIFGVPRLYGAKNLSYGVPNVGVGGTENREAVPKKRVLTRHALEWWSWS